MVAAYDPGVTTGYARAAFDTTARGKTLVPFSLLDAAALPTINDIHAMLTYRSDVRIVENFIGSGVRTREAIDTLKLVGYLQHSDGALEVVMHVPQWRKAYVAEAVELMASAGIPKNQHAADALAHILYYYYTVYRRE